jgi:alginate O-acetyltransferase complex protein AlgI
VAFAAVALLVIALAAGFAATHVASRAAARASAWSLVLLAVIAMERLTADEPAGVRMIAIILALLYAMKAVVTVESRADLPRPLRPAEWVAFAAGWFGMRPKVFVGLGGPPREGWRRLVSYGLRRVVIGIGLVVARLVWPTGAVVAATAIACVGLSLFLHFGVFNVVAGLWRALGADTGPLFREPLRSRSLSEFWGRRWNLAFSEMTAIAVYRPLGAVVGRPAALVVAFLSSGLLHELAISVPVRAGYGLPFTYFLVHSALLLGERQLEARGHPIQRHGVLARLWTFGWLVLPVPLVFHPPFLAGVVWPLLR